MEEYEKIGKMLDNDPFYVFKRKIKDYLNWYRDNFLFYYDSEI